MRYVTSALAASALFLLATSCASTHTAKVKGVDDPYQRKGRIQWNSRKLKGLLKIEAADAKRTESGLLRVRLVFRNKKRKDVAVDVRTRFTGEDGFEMEKTNWEAIICTARTQTEYETVSISPDVYDYQVIIRDPKQFSWNP